MDFLGRCAGSFLVLGVAMYGQGAPSVIEAVQKGHGVGQEQAGVEAVRAALAAGGDVNERDVNGWTPLMYACLECRAEIVELLIRRGADVRLRASDARVTTFLDHGQGALEIGSSCFMARRRAEIAPGRGFPESTVRSELSAPQRIVGLLIRAGADVNGREANGKTPLMMAAMHGWDGAVRELLAAKADVGARDPEGRLAIDHADPLDEAVTGMLRQAGSPEPSGRSGRTVCDAQRALGRLGYNSPIIDCIAGRQFREVLLKFQGERKLSPSGELDGPTRKALELR